MIIKRVLMVNVGGKSCDEEEDIYIITIIYVGAVYCFAFDAGTGAEPFSFAHILHR